MHRFSTAADGDILIRSSDDISFFLHRKNMETYAGAFPLNEAEWYSGEEVLEILPLEESSEVLEVVFEFLHPKRYPDLEDKDFISLISIADAVEKYEVFAAMNTCTSRLKSFVHIHPRQIFTHALKYGLGSLLNAAVSYLMFCDPLVIAEELPSYAILPWLRYRKSINEAIFDTVRTALRSSWAHLDRPTPRSSRKGDSYLKMDMLCRNCFAAWIAYLENLSSRAAFEEELKNKAHFTRIIHSDCNSGKVHGNWLEHLAKLCEDGLERGDGIKFVPDFWEVTVKSPEALKKHWSQSMTDGSEREFRFDFCSPI